MKKCPSPTNTWFPRFMQKTSGCTWLLQWIDVACEINYKQSCFQFLFFSVISCPTWQLFLVCITTVAKCKTKFIFYVKNTRVSLRRWCLRDRYPVLRLQVFLIDFMLKGRMFHRSVYKFQLHVKKGTCIPIFWISVQNTDNTPFQLWKSIAATF